MTTSTGSVNDVGRRARDLAATVLDPELPMVTIEDLGILRDVTEDDQGRVHVTITPTYSGCPAMETIRARPRRDADLRRLPARRRGVRAEPGLVHRRPDRGGPRQAGRGPASRRPGRSVPGPTGRSG